MGTDHLAGTELPDSAATSSSRARPETRRSRLGLFLVLGCVTAIGPAAMYLYLPGLPQLARDVGVSQSAAQSTVTTFLIGMAFGQLLAGPISDVHGRRRPLIAGLAAFTAASAACALAPNLYVLDAVRLVQGITGAIGVTIGRAIVRDLYAGAAAARYLSRLILITGLSPILSPILGGQILRFFSWRGLFVTVGLLGLAVLLATARVLPETLPPQRRRPAGLGETKSVFARLLADRVFTGYVLVGGFNVAALTAYVAGSSFIVEDVYGASPRVYGVLFGVGSLVLVVGAQVNAHLLRRVPPRRLLGFGSATCVAAATLLLALVPFHGAGLLTFMVPIALLMFSYGFIPSNLLGLALTDHPDVAGSAAALLGAGMFAFGAVAAPLAGVGGDGTALPMALVLFGCSIAGAVTLKLLVPAGGRAPVDPVVGEV